MKNTFTRWILIAVFINIPSFYAFGSETIHTSSILPVLESYQDGHMTDLMEILAHRIHQNPFNLIASLIFVCAIFHTFLANQFVRLAHKWNRAHKERVKDNEDIWHDTHLAQKLCTF